MTPVGSTRSRVDGVGGDAHGREREEDDEGQLEHGPRDEVRRGRHEAVLHLRAHEAALEVQREDEEARDLRRHGREPNMEPHLVEHLVLVPLARLDVDDREVRVAEHEAQRAREEHERVPRQEERLAPQERRELVRDVGPRAVAVEVRLGAQGRQIRLRVALLPRVRPRVEQLVDVTFIREVRVHEVQQEVRRITAVGMDTSYLRRRQHHHRRLVSCEPGLHGQAIEQVELRAAGGEQLVVAGPLQGSAYGAARHAAVACHEDAVFGSNQRGQTAPPAALIASGLVGGFSIEPTTAKPLRFR